MKLTSYPSAGEFLAVAEPELLRDEAKNNLMLGIARAVRGGRSYGGDPPYFLAVHDGRALVSAAIRTPPYNLILYSEQDRPDVLDPIVSHLAERDPGLPGAHGAVGLVSAFAERWTKTMRVGLAVEMSQRVYRLTEVTPPKGVPGTARRAEERDVETLIRWFLAFCEEAVPSDPPPDTEASVRRFMDPGVLMVWDAGGIVSMAGSSRGSTHGATVSAVYTPPDRRGNGYASACVAALSQLLLDRGSAFCTLYADVSNSTSNKIYQHVGYRPLADCAMVSFIPADSETD